MYPADTAKSHPWTRGPACWDLCTHWVSWSAGSPQPPVSHWILLGGALYPLSSFTTETPMFSP